MPVLLTLNTEQFCNRQEEEKERRKFAKGPTGNRIEHSTEDELPDATSTNIFLGSLSLQVTEEVRSFLLVRLHCLNLNHI